MKLGFSLPTSGAWATPENQVRVAQEAERLGYHSLWVFFLEGNFDPRGPSLDRALTVLTALAPARR